MSTGGVVVLRHRSHGEEGAADRDFGHAAGHPTEQPHLSLPASLHHHRNRPANVGVETIGCRGIILHALHLLRTTMRDNRRRDRLLPHVHRLWRLSQGTVPAPLERLRRHPSWNPIPFYHAYPGSRCLTIGTTSCNFRCRYCSNAYIAKEDPEIQQDRMYHLTPSRAGRHGAKAQLPQHRIQRQRAYRFHTFPSRGGAKRQRRQAIPMGCLTNGYTTVESTELLASIFSFFNVSLKGISADFNRDIYRHRVFRSRCLRNIRRLAQDRHVEVTTPIIQGANDSEIDTIADFLAEVDPEIPWHVFRLLPEDEMKGAEYPNIQAIDTALQSARKRLPYIYFHNFVGSEWVNTLCPECRSAVIERFSLGCGGDKLNRLLCEERQMSRLRPEDQSGERKTLLRE